MIHLQPTLTTKRKVARLLQTSFLAIGVITIFWGVFAQVTGAVMAASLPDDELQALNEYPNWVDHILTCGPGGAEITLTGADNEEKIWNFFKSEQLSDAQTAGVMGNMEQESGFDPTEKQGGGDSNNPADAGSGGWGIVQWTPGTFALSEQKKYNVSGNIYDLATQLNIVWDEMTKTSPVGVNDMVQHLKTINDPAQAASDFVTNFEGGTDPGGIRETYAQQIMKKLGGSGGAGGSTPTTNGSCSSSGSPNCTTATGDAKIICEAKQYDPVSYSESEAGNHLPGGNPAWLKTCPKIGPSCFLDCSGLVNIAVYDAFGYNLEENTYLEASDTTHWQHIPFSKLAPGDLIQPAAEAGGHVEIVDHVQGQTIYTFGAHTDQVPQPDQVSPASFQASGGDLYLHWIGPTN